VKKLTIRTSKPSITGYAVSAEREREALRRGEREEGERGERGERGRLQF